MGAVGAGGAEELGGEELGGGWEKNMEKPVLFIGFGVFSLFVPRGLQAAFLFEKGVFFVGS